MNLRKTYNQIAKDWHQDHLKDDWWVEGVDKYISFLKKGDLILDAGCGTGVKSKYMANKGLRVVGIDFSEKMIEIAKQEFPQGSFFILNISEADKLEFLFDGIFMQAVLLHIPKKEIRGTLNKVMSRLKSNGYLYVAVKKQRSKNVDEEIKTENDYGYLYKRFFSYFTSDEVRFYLEEAGLKTIYSEITPNGNTDWIQVIGRK